MNVRICILTFGLLVSSSMQAQTDDFKAFREQMLSDYQGFRKGIMDRYVEFLDAAWAEFETMAGQRRVTKPKPVIAPVYTPPEEPVVEKPKGPVVEEPKEPVVVEPETPTEPKQPTVPQEPRQPTTPKVPTTPKAPSKPKIPSSPTLGEDLGGATIRFTLYGLQLAVPAPKLEATLCSVNQQEVVAFWKQINESDTKACVEGLQQLAANYRLGDWCTLKAIEQYCSKWIKGNEAAARVMMQYLMLSMGYDVRLAIAGDRVYLLLPFEQKVYANTYISVDDTRYYIYPNTMPENSRIYSCSIPSEEECGRHLNLIINPAYLLPKDNHLFAVSYGGLSAEGSVNKNVIALQQEYPSMDIYCYAASVADEEVRRSVVKQLASQMEGMSEAEAANALLHFVQSAFEYKTDGQQFGEGVEKPFFFEETLYHPYCDCEDRSIFYSYLVKHVLGLEVVLVHFPGHACTAVAFSEPPKRRTVTYDYKGRRFYICDPTYIMADVGMCMPSFVDAKPTFMEWYNIKEQ